MKSSAFLVLLAGVGLAASQATANDRQLVLQTTYFGQSLEQYCADQLGRTDLSHEDLWGCERLYQAEMQDFLILEDEADPVARQGDELPGDADFGDAEDEFEFDIIDEEPAGRTGRARKKGTATGEDDFDFEDDEDPIEDEFGFDFEFEGTEEPEDPIESFDFEPLDDPDDEPLGELSDLPETEPEPKVEAPATTGSASAGRPASIQLDVLGKTPLADNYQATIVATDRDSVVVELPLLLGRSRADFDGISYCIVAEVLADGNKVAEARQQVTSSSLAEFGPSFAFIKLLAPVTSKAGNLEIRVSKASNMSAKPTHLFTQRLGYQLP